MIILGKVEFGTLNQERNRLMRGLVVSWFIVAFICLSTVTARGALDKSLVLYLTFGEGKGDIVADVSFYHNNGVIKGDPDWVAGKAGFALEFDGDGDTVEIAHDDSLNITTAATMAMWVNVPTAGEEEYQAGIEKGTWDDAGEYSLYPVYEGRSTVVQFAELPDDCDDMTTGRDIQDNEWHHLAGTWDGQTISLYIDGELEKSCECAGELGTNTKKLYIGSRMGELRFFTGTVDEVRIYNRALTQKEIQKDMETFDGSSVSPSGKLAVCWGKLKWIY